MLLKPPLRILHLFTSPAHNFFGHHGRQPGEHPTTEVPEVVCVAGRGIEGDRFFDYKDSYNGQITFFSEEVFESVCRELNIRGKSPGAFRRNVVCAGLDLNTLTGNREFEVQGVVFRGREECRPCQWMDVAIGPGAEKALRGRGGLRAEIVRGGVLRVDEK